MKTDKGKVPVIKATNVKKIYYPDILALEGFDFEMQPGEIVSLVGPSGCGKTTFLRIVAGYEPIQEGKVYFNGGEILGTDPRRQVIFQDIRILPWLTVSQNMEIPLIAKKLPKERRREKVNEILEKMDLVSIKDTYGNDISSGMQQKAAMSRVLLGDPDLILCDEPFNTLDIVARETLQNLLLKIRYETKKSILFVTHNVAEAVLVGQRVVAMTVRPGRTKEIMEVDLPEKRWEMPKDEPKYLELVRHLASLVEDEVTRGRELEKLVGY